MTLSVRRYDDLTAAGLTWLATAPRHWRRTRLKHIAPFQVGWTPPTGNAANFDGSNLWANISDIKERIVADTAKRISDAAAAAAPMSITPRGSLLFSFKLSVGAVCFAGKDMYTNEAIASFLPNNVLPLSYLYYALPLFVLQNAATNIYGASILNQELIRNACMLAPPHDEAVRIAKFLDYETAKIDALIDKQRQLIALLNEKRQAVISHAVTKGLNPDAPLRDSGIEWIGNVPAHWKVAKCGHYLSVLCGFAFPSAGFTADESGVRLLRGTNVGVASVRWDDVVYWHRKPGDKLETYELHEGDLVLGMDRPVISEGVRVAKLQKDDLPCLLLQRVASLKPSRLLLSDYLLHLLSSEMFTAHFSPETTGVSVPHISPAQIRNFVVPIPPIEEQAEIVAELQSKVTAIDALLAKSACSASLLQERRAALISAAVTGKIDVRNWKAPDMDPETAAATETEVA